MGGHTVAVEEPGGRRTIFMVREPDADKACALASRLNSNLQAYVVGPVSDVTLDYFNIQPDRLVTIHSHQCDEVLCCHME